MKGYNNGKAFSGVGYVLNKADGDRLIGIDLDAMERAGKKVRGLYRLLLKKGAYIEKSPSGTGLRAFVYGDMKTRGHNKEGIEI